MVNQNDEQLMLAIAAGNRSAFSVLYDRYSEKLFRFFLKMLNNNKEKAEDFLQDIFMKLVEKPHLFNPDNKFSTWIYSIAHNMCKNEYRKMDVRKIMSNNVGDQAVEKPCNNVAQEKKVDLGFFDKELQDNLLNLDEDKQTTFNLRHHSGLSIKEIAEIMLCSEGTVKSRLFYTHKHLSKHLSHFRNISEK